MAAVIWLNLNYVIPKSINHTCKQNCSRRLLKTLRKRKEWPMISNSSIFTTFSILFDFHMLFAFFISPEHWRLNLIYSGRVCLSVCLSLMFSFTRHLPLQYCIIFNHNATWVFILLSFKIIRRNLNEIEVLWFQRHQKWRKMPELKK